MSGASRSGTNHTQYLLHSTTFLTKRARGTGDVLLPLLNRFLHSSSWDQSLENISFRECNDGPLSYHLIHWQYTTEKPSIHCGVALFRKNTIPHNVTWHWVATQIKSTLWTIATVTNSSNWFGYTSICRRYFCYFYSLSTWCPSPVTPPSLSV